MYRWADRVLYMVCVMIDVRMLLEAPPVPASLSSIALGRRLERKAAVASIAAGIFDPPQGCSDLTQQLLKTAKDAAEVI